MKNLLMLAAALTIGSTLTSAGAAPYVNEAKYSNAKGTPDMGGVLRGANLADFKTINPFTYRESPSLPGSILVAGGLLGYDAYSGDFTPYMAESYTQSADKTLFTLKIRKGMKWSDGEDITADDYMTTYTIERDEKVGSNAFSGWYPNEKPIIVKKLDAYTITIKYPNADVTALEFIGAYAPQPSHIFDSVYKTKGAEGIKAMWSVSTPAAQIVSAGPFKLERYVPGERVTLTKNKFFGEWNKDSAGRALPYLDGLQINIVADANAQLAAFLAGNTDVYQPGDRDKLAQVKAAIDAKKLTANLLPNASSRASSDFVVFNQDTAGSFKGKLFRNVKFRQVFSQLVNRDAMVDLVLGGLGVPTYTGVYPVYKDWVAGGADQFKFNPTAAAATLKSLGFSKKDKDGVLVDAKGNRLEFTLIANAENTRRQQYAKIIADEALKVGVKINTSFIAFNQMSGLLDAKPNFAPRSFDAIMIGLVGGGLTYPVSSDNVITCNNLPADGNLHMFNQTGKCIYPFETQIVNLYYKGRGEFNLAKRKDVAVSIQKLEAANQPVTYLAAQTVHYAWQTKVQGEVPKQIMRDDLSNVIYGPRDLALTWINK
ncbi:ABC transporter substrate-binding protein [Deinococcus sp.]|uniref:ABC transporter substrate-binding protein n=1 Tax=Deinococcus sp. TaxID=47478 RepID=UPI0025D8A5D6|nr:ABC transporter substrate-binding protein [Deinococcus sp.]